MIGRCQGLALACLLAIALSVRAQEPDDTLPAIPPIDGPLGFAGPSRVAVRESQTDERFIPIEDRWRIGFPLWDRYGTGQVRGEDVPYMFGNIWNPFNQNVLKADYPLFRQDIFLDLTASTQTLFEPRQTLTATTPFESTVNPNQRDFFGSPNQSFFSQNFLVALDLFKGDAAFRPVDWRIKVTGIFNINNLAVSELANVNPDVTRGTDR